jgi:hypothetical protein
MIGWIYSIRGRWGIHQDVSRIFKNEDFEFGLSIALGSSYGDQAEPRSPGIRDQGVFDWLDQTLRADR